MDAAHLGLGLVVFLIAFALLFDVMNGLHDALRHPVGPTPDATPFNPG
jgi:hypothetical protein